MQEIIKGNHVPKLFEGLNLTHLTWDEIKEPLEWLINIPKPDEDRLYFKMFCLYYKVNLEKTKVDRAYSYEEILGLYSYNSSWNIKIKKVKNAVRKFVSILKILIILNRHFGDDFTNQDSTENENISQWLDNMMSNKEDFKSFCEPFNIQVDVRLGSPLDYRSTLNYIKNYYNLKKVEG